MSQASAAYGLISIPGRVVPLDDFILAAYFIRESLCVQPCSPSDGSNTVDTNSVKQSNRHRFRSYLSDKNFYNFTQIVLDIQQPKNI